MSDFGDLIVLVLFLFPFSLCRSSRRALVPQRNGSWVVKLGGVLLLLVLSCFCGSSFKDVSTQKTG